MCTNPSVADIIIIDDDESFTQATSLLLEDYGYTVYQALTGKSGIYKLLEIQPDLVIIDVHLPDINGIDVAREVRHTCPATPLIMISSDHSHDNAEKCLALDVYAFLHKPLFPDNLLKAITKALDKSKD